MYQKRLDILLPRQICKKIELEVKGRVMRKKLNMKE